MQKIMRLSGILGAYLLISAIFPVAVLASDIESKLFQSCLSSSNDPQSKINRDACSCYANKLASGRVKSFGEAEGYLNVDAQLQQELIEDWDSKDWLPPDFELGSTNIVHFNEKQAQRFAIAINVGFACYHEDNRENL